MYETFSAYAPLLTLFNLNSPCAPVVVPAKNALSGSVINCTVAAITASPVPFSTTVPLISYTLWPNMPTCVSHIMAIINISFFIFVLFSR